MTRPRDRLKPRKLPGWKRRSNASKPRSKKGYAFRLKKRREGDLSLRLPSNNARHRKRKPNACKLKRKLLRKPLKKKQKELQLQHSKSMTRAVANSSRLNKTSVSTTDTIDLKQASLTSPFKIISNVKSFSFR